MRPLPLVIDAITKQVPDDYDQKEALLEKMARTRDSACYAAPEVMQIHWQAVMHHLNEHVGEPDVEWKKTVEAIMTAKADYKDFL